MGKRVLVTGAGRGLGYAVASIHLSAGDEVYAYEYALTEELNALEQSSGGKLHVRQCDIACTESVQNAVSDLTAAGGQLDIIYNVAGIYLHDAREGLAQTDLDAGLHMYSVNSVGLLRVCKAVLPLIGKGTMVVNITSESGSITDCHRSYEYMYCMSKAAANMASKLLFNELKPLGGGVICVHPGWLRTQMGGERAMASDHAITAEKSARDIIGIVGNMKEMPSDLMFVWHNGKSVPW